MKLSVKDNQKCECNVFKFASTSASWLTLETPYKLVAAHVKSTSKTCVETTVPETLRRCFFSDLVFAKKHVIPDKMFGKWSFLTGQTLLIRLFLGCITVKISVTQRMTGYEMFSYILLTTKDSSKDASEELFLESQLWHGQFDLCNATSSTPRHSSLCHAFPILSISWVCTLKATIVGLHIMRHQTPTA